MLNDADIRMAKQITRQIGLRGIVSLHEHREIEAYPGSECKEFNAFSIPWKQQVHISLKSWDAADRDMRHWLLWHEFAHVAARYQQCDEPVHGPTWQKLMKKAGYGPWPYAHINKDGRLQVTEGLACYIKPVQGANNREKSATIKAWQPRPQRSFTWES